MAGVSDPGSMLDYLAKLAAAVDLARGRCGLQFRMARDARGWSLKEAARRSGLSTATLSRLERGLEWSDQAARLYWFSLRRKPRRARR